MTHKAPGVHSHIISIDCRSTTTKVITIANQRRAKEYNEPMRINKK